MLIPDSPWQGRPASNELRSAECKRPTSTWQTRFSPFISAQKAADSGWMVGNSYLGITSGLPVTRSQLRALRLSDSQLCSSSDKISRMELKVLFSEDPAFVIRRADKFLSSEPVLHNLILSILHSRVAQGDPGRYWIALHGEEAVGVVVQSPLEYPATLTPMEPRAVLAIVDAIAEAGVTLAGVNGDAATAASFAGQWSERCKSAATPFQGTRLYELLELGEVPSTAGHLRQACPRDRSLMILWTRAFQDEIVESANDTERRVDRALAAGQIWLWDQNGETTSMAVGREPAQGVEIGRAHV